jgi:ribosomal-protein-alanine N-acetyltransferase
MPEWIIERLQLERDLDEVVALEALCFSNPTTREMFQWEAQKSDVSEAYVMRPASAGNVAGTAEGGGMAAARAEPPSTHRPILAYCSTWLIFDELHINTLAVHPDWRRRGLASRLLAHVLRDAMRHGAEKATLEVRRSNDAARQLYQRFGFELGGVRPAYYRNPVEDALILWRIDLRSVILDPLPQPPKSA